MHESVPLGLNEKTKRPLGQSMSLGGDPEKLAAYYNEWAASYDDDVGQGESYGLPTSVLFTLDAAIEIEPWLAEPTINVLDAGCGTGRVGVALASRGYRNLDGVDLSSEMAVRAEARGVYRQVEAGVDLTQPPSELRARAADLVVVGGVFTVGHIPPESLYPVASLVRPGGVLIVTVRPGYYDTTDFAEVSQGFVADGTAEALVYFPELPYTEDTLGMFYAWRIN